jgi:hypothetical protein
MDVQRTCSGGYRPTAIRGTLDRVAKSLSGVAGARVLGQASGAAATWQKQPSARALCGKEIASENGKYETQYEGDMIGWPTCHACFKQAS